MFGAGHEEKKFDINVQIEKKQDLAG